MGWPLAGRGLKCGAQDRFGFLGLLFPLVGRSASGEGSLAGNPGEGPVVSCWTPVRAGPVMRGVASFGLTMILVCARPPGREVVPDGRERFQSGFGVFDGQFPSRGVLCRSGEGAGNKAFWSAA